MNERFREELERWARRPPERSAPVARTRVLAQMGLSRPGRPGFPWKLPVAAALLAGLALVLVLSLRGNPGHPVQPAPPETPARNSQRLVVLQLQSGTKIYVVMKGDPS